MDPWGQRGAPDATLRGRARSPGGHRGAPTRRASPRRTAPPGGTDEDGLALSFASPQLASAMIAREVAGCEEVSHSSFTKLYLPLQPRFFLRCR